MSAWLFVNLTFFLFYAHFVSPSSFYTFGCTSRSFWSNCDILSLFYLVCFWICRFSFLCAHLSSFSVILQLSWGHSIPLLVVLCLVWNAFAFTFRVFSKRQQLYKGGLSDSEDYLTVFVFPSVTFHDVLSGVDAEMWNVFVGAETDRLNKRIKSPKGWLFFVFGVCSEASVIIPTHIHRTDSQIKRSPGLSAKQPSISSVSAPISPHHHNAALITQAELFVL